MVDVWLTSGLPASGKSTWAKKFCAESGAVRLEMDCYREMMGFPAGSSEWTKDNEKLAFEAMLSNLVSLVKAGRDVVLSNTHLNRKWALRYKQALQFEDVTFWLVSFHHVGLDTCIERDAARDVTVGEDVIRRMFKGYQGVVVRKTNLTEAWLNEPLFVLKKYEGTPGKPPAFLVDLDGTWASMGPRGPYDNSKVHLDGVNKHVDIVVRALRAYGMKAVIMSGRDEGEALEGTKLWQAKHAIIADDMFMRKPGDRRRDDVVKHDLFWEFVAPNYDVKFTLDDRQRVVDTWRAMGIPCHQSAPGDF